MKSNPIPLLLIGLLVSFAAPAQVNFSPSQQDTAYTILLQSGKFYPAKNITTENINRINQSLNKQGDTAFIILQFEKIPSATERKQLATKGIFLLDYVPHNAYTAIVVGGLQNTILQSYGARSAIELSASQKMSFALATGNFNRSLSNGSITVNISFPKIYTAASVIEKLQLANFDIVDTKYLAYRIISVSTSIQRLSTLAGFPFIEFVEATPGEDEPLSPYWTNWGRDAVRATPLSASLANGGENLQGKDVVVGIGDNADFQLHVDFSGRLINRAAINYAYHGTHVAGIVGGAGNINEVRTGFAPKATLLSQTFSKILTNASAYVNDFGMVITNNSYGNDVSECATFGVYNLYAKVLDDQAFILPNLQTVFAGGNSGLKNCSPFPDSFHTILGGYQSAKNSITVGNSLPFDSIFKTSSRGPVRDGRIKPEIVANGTYIESTVPAQSYGENTGTSMAAPAIAGGLALLYEKYKAGHAGVNPQNALMKALVCNSGDDKGNPGPDFTYGFGIANFKRAVDMLKNNRFYEGNIASGTDNIGPINVPAGTAELKVMLYWNDPSAAPVVTQTLVNDLDLTVETPSASTVLPLILDTASADIKNFAHNGEDHINNIEQVVIKNPTAGNYTFHVKATSITQNPSQDYVVVYDMIPIGIQLTAPFGGEKYLQGENMIVRWDDYGNPHNTFTVEYSTDDGVNWTTLKDDIAPDKRSYFYTAPDPNEWFQIPAVTTDKARVRITRNGTGYASTSLPFVISDTVFVSLSAVQCEGYFSIDWTPEPAATGYEVMLLRGETMQHIATVSASTFSYAIGGLSKDSVYWATVRPLIGAGNTPGRRAVAISRQPNSGSCTGIISDKDCKLDSILSPVWSGRLLTASALSNSVPITVRIKNLDDVATSGNIDVFYSLNGGTPVSATINNPNIPAGNYIDYSFPAAVDLSAIGTYDFKIYIVKADDPVGANDTLSITVKQLANDPITGIIPSSPFIDNFDAAPVQSFQSKQIGLTGLDRYDFVNSTAKGRIRTFINTGMAYSGNRALTLDASILNTGTIDSLTGTYNLATYDAATEDVRLDFRFKNHGQENNAANKVWIRGSDQDNWIAVYDLFANQPDADGQYKLSTSIELSDYLQNAVPAQNFSTSFQVRWGQYGKSIASDNTGSAGYTFDDIRLYKVTNDIQMVSIDTPYLNSCDLNTTTPIQITVRNSSNTAVSNIPVRYRINAGSWVNETIASTINANASFQYTFTTTANFSAVGSYLVETEVQFTTDDYHENDTASVRFYNAPLITVTDANPYLNDFESDDGYWRSAGKNSSWEYGTPASYKINKAASGSKAWKTSLAGNYNDNEKSYLLSPCYDISSMTNPTLSFSMALDMEDCGNNFCDGAFVEYSIDGKTWDTLGTYGQGTNWFNKNYSPSGNTLWSQQNYQYWHVATIPLAVIPLPVSALTHLRFRFVIQSDDEITREGLAIDDIHIYSNPYGIYDGATMASPVTNTIPGGSGWVDFLSGGKLVASVNAPVSMGSTDAQAYIHTGPHRVSSLQLYLNRNITIKPTTVNLSDSAIVRFYFLDAEADTLIRATNCGYCYKPASAYELGVTKYSDTNDNQENGTLDDNIGGVYKFIIAAKTKIIPFDKGYYAEFKVKDFSEFWLNNGGVDLQTPLPLHLVDFKAQKINAQDVITSWITENEQNVDRFEIEVARGNVDYTANRFSMVGTVRSTAVANIENRYQFIDHENNKTGVRYYRLKMIDKNNHFTYSPVRPVVFTNDMDWKVYPNPSAGIFNLIYQCPNGELVTIKIFDVAGRVVKTYTVQATGFLQRFVIDLGESNLSKGPYLLQASHESEQHFFKLIKQ